jgi:hypothetical protein
VFAVTNPYDQTIIMFKIRQRPLAILGTSLVAILILSVITSSSSSSSSFYKIPTAFSESFSLPSFPSSSSASSSGIQFPFWPTGSTQSIKTITSNSTLGFAKIFAVGLPERQDKRDALTLAASLTGFDVEFVDGVHGGDIPDKAVPFGINRTRMMDTNLGRWRGHMNAVRRYVSP